MSDDPNNVHIPKHLYMFDMGNSTDGPIGYVARIGADTKEEAVERLKELLPEYVEVNPEDLRSGEYINVYFNYDKAITEDGIVDSETEDYLTGQSINE